MNKPGVYSTTQGQGHMNKPGVYSMTQGQGHRNKPGVYSMTQGQGHECLNLAEKPRKQRIIINIKLTTEF